MEKAGTLDKRDNVSEMKWNLSLGDKFGQTDRERAGSTTPAGAVSRARWWARD